MSWCDDDLDVFSNVGERELDFLLLEELRCSEDFRAWFLRESLAELGVNQCPGSGKVRHSVHRTGESTGETDLLIEFDAVGGDGEGTYAILVEDKIDAQFSNRTKSGLSQTQRYQIELDKKVAAGDWVGGILVLVAPSGYLRSVDTSPFGATVALEDVDAWLAKREVDSSGELAVRIRHKRHVLEAASTRWRRGWAREASSTVSNMWSYYHDIASAAFADLNMTYKGGEPGDSYHVNFKCLERKDERLKCTMWHDMENGYADLRLDGAAHRLAVLNSSLRPLLTPEMKMRKGGKSAFIYIKVDRIDRHADPRRQEDAIRQALQAVRQLRQWYDEHWEALL